MKKEKFLGNCADNDLRIKLYNLFNKAEIEAKQFSDEFNNWIEIREVIQNDKEDCMWGTGGNITIDPYKLARCNDFGALFHEIFHSAFHESPLWQCDRCRKWGDGFCDAFRYFMEDKLLENGAFYRKLNDGYIHHTFAENLNVCGRDNRHDIQYAIPASLIVKKAHCSLQDFKRLWIELNNEFQTSNNNDKYLEDYFEFPMKELQIKYNCNL
jgi:hypothetical protein